MQIYLYSFRVIEEHDDDDDDDDENEDDSTNPVSKNITLPTNQAGAGIKVKLGIILSAILNTCSGIFSVFSLNTVDQDVIDQWSNRLPSQLTFIPRWVYKK